jgi:hypothetical protein
MTVSRPYEFGPYAFTLAPAEAEAAAARLSLRIALNRGSVASRLAPLALFTLVVLAATVLALTGAISRRLGELALILAAAAFMMQRLASRLRLRNAQRGGKAAMARLRSDRALTTTVDSSGITLTGERNTMRLNFSECEEAEVADGLVYLWPHRGLPIVLPDRVLPEGEADRLIADIRKRLAVTRSPRFATTASLLRGLRS